MFFPLFLDVFFSFSFHLRNVIFGDLSDDVLVGYFFLLVTWVHPSSSLLGWSPVSALELVDVVVAGAVVVVVVHGGDDAVLVVFCGQDREK